MVFLCGGREEPEPLSQVIKCILNCIYAFKRDYKYYKPSLFLREQQKQSTRQVYYIINDDVVIRELSSSGRTYNLVCISWRVNIIAKSVADESKSSHKPSSSLRWPVLLILGTGDPVVTLVVAAQWYGVGFKQVSHSVSRVRTWAVLTNRSSSLNIKSIDKVVDWHQLIKQ